jgi:hypothetical protein
MSHEPQQDVFDYAMSDTFVSETRHLPYRTGFRSRRHPRRPSLAYINSLCDREFTAYLRNDCRLSSTDSDAHVELDEVRAELQELKSELQAIRRAMTKPALISSSQRGGLNVSPRT